MEQEVILAPKAAPLLRNPISLQ